MREEAGFGLVNWVLEIFDSNCSYGGLGRGECVSTDREEEKNKHDRKDL